MMSTKMKYYETSSDEEFEEIVRRPPRFKKKTRFLNRDEDDCPEQENEGNEENLPGTSRKGLKQEKEGNKENVPGTSKEGLNQEKEGNKEIVAGTSKKIQSKVRPKVNKKFTRKTRSQNRNKDLRVKQENVRDKENVPGTSRICVKQEKEENKEKVPETKKKRKAKVRPKAEPRNPFEKVPAMSMTAPTYALPSKWDIDAFGMYMHRNRINMTKLFREERGVEMDTPAMDHYLREGWRFRDYVKTELKKFTRESEESEKDFIIRTRPVFLFKQRLEYEANPCKELQNCICIRTL